MTIRACRLTSRATGAVAGVTSGTNARQSTPRSGPRDGTRAPETAGHRDRDAVTGATTHRVAETWTVTGADAGVDVAAMRVATEAAAVADAETDGAGTRVATAVAAEVDAEKDEAAVEVVPRVEPTGRLALGGVNIGSPVFRGRQGRRSWTAGGRVVKWLCAGFDDCAVEPVDIRIHGLRAYPPPC